MRVAAPRRLSRALAEWLLATRLLPLLVLFLLLRGATGCSSALPYPDFPDAGAGPDAAILRDAALSTPDLVEGCRIVDLGLVSCDELAAAAFAWRRCHAQCVTDADCVLYYSADYPPCVGHGCLLPVNRAFETPYVAGLVTDWISRCRGAGGGCTCGSFRAAVCNQGMCDGVL